LFDAVVLGVILVPSILAGLAIRSALRDPDNWALDADRKRIRFHNWTELAAYGAILAAVTVFLVLIAG